MGRSGSVSAKFESVVRGLELSLVSSPWCVVGFSRLLAKGRAPVAAMNDLRRERIFSELLDRLSAAFCLTRTEVVSTVGLAAASKERECRRRLWRSFRRGSRYRRHRRVYDRSRCVGQLSASQLARMKFDAMVLVRKGVLVSYCLAEQFFQKRCCKSRCRFSPAAFKTWWEDILAMGSKLRFTWACVNINGFEGHRAHLEVVVKSVRPDVILFQEMRSGPSPPPLLGYTIFVQPRSGSMDGADGGGVGVLLRQSFGGELDPHLSLVSDGPSEMEWLVVRCLPFPHFPIACVSVYMPPRACVQEAERIDQLARLIHLLSEEMGDQGLVLVGGDFNSDVFGMGPASRRCPGWKRERAAWVLSALSRQVPAGRLHRVAASYTFTSQSSCVSSTLDAIFCVGSHVLKRPLQSSQVEVGSDHSMLVVPTLVRMVAPAPASNPPLDSVPRAGGDGSAACATQRRICWRRLQAPANQKAASLSPGTVAAPPGRRPSSRSASSSLPVSLPSSSCSAAPFSSPPAVPQPVLSTHLLVSEATLLSFRQQIAALDLDDILVYTDGACSGNPGPGGWGVALLYEGGSLVLSGGAPSTTNNEMELLAAEVALLVVPDDVFLLVCTDSRYVQHGAMTRVWSWRREGFRTKQGTVVSNMAGWARVATLMERRNFTCRFDHVKGHSGDPWNVAVDRLACSERDFFAGAAAAAASGLHAIGPAASSASSAAFSAPASSPSAIVALPASALQQLGPGPAEDDLPRAIAPIQHFGPRGLLFTQAAHSALVGPALLSCGTWADLFALVSRAGKQALGCSRCAGGSKGSRLKQASLLARLKRKQISTLRAVQHLKLRACSQGVTAAVRARLIAKKAVLKAIRKRERDERQRLRRQSCADLQYALLVHHQSRPARLAAFVFAQVRRLRGDASRFLLREPSFSAQEMNEAWGPVFDGGSGCRPEIQSRLQLLLAQVIERSRVSPWFCSEQEAISWERRWSSRPQDLASVPFPSLFHRDIPDFTVEEVAAAIAGMKSGRASGIDGIPSEAIKCLPRSALPLLAKLVTAVVKGQMPIPDVWKQALVVLLPKVKGRQPLPLEFRPISLLCAFAKMVELLVIRRILAEYFIRTGRSSPFHEAQAGFVRGRSCSDHVLVMKLVQLLAEDKGGSLPGSGMQVCVAFIDFLKAFDRVPADKLALALLGQRIAHPQYVAFLVSWLVGHTRRLRIPGNSLDLPVTRGVPQGGVSSPILWDVLVNCLSVAINARMRRHKSPKIRPVVISRHVRVSHGLFADDLTLLAYDEESLQQLVDVVARWARFFEMEISPEKSECLAFGKGAIGKDRPLRICIPGKDGLGLPVLLEHVCSFRYLGVMLQDSSGRFGRRGSANLKADYRIQLAKDALDALKMKINPRRGWTAGAALMALTSCILPLMSWCAETECRGSWLNRAEAVYNQLVKHALGLSKFAHSSLPVQFSGCGSLRSVLACRMLGFLLHCYRSPARSVRLLFKDQIADFAFSRDGDAALASSPYFAWLHNVSEVVGGSLLACLDFFLSDLFHAWSAPPLHKQRSMARFYDLLLSPSINLLVNSLLQAPHSATGYGDAFLYLLASSPALPEPGRDCVRSLIGAAVSLLRFHAKATKSLAFRFFPDLVPALLRLSMPTLRFEEEDAGRSVSACLLCNQGRWFGGHVLRCCSSPQVVALRHTLLCTLSSCGLKAEPAMSLLDDLLRLDLLPLDNLELAAAAHRDDVVSAVHLFYRDIWHIVSTASLLAAPPPPGPPLVAPQKKRQMGGKDAAGMKPTWSSCRKSRKRPRSGGRHSSSAFRDNKRRKINAAPSSPPLRLSAGSPDSSAGPPAAVSASLPHRSRLAPRQLFPSGGPPGGPGPGGSCIGGPDAPNLGVGLRALRADAPDFVPGRSWWSAVSFLRRVCVPQAGVVPAAVPAVSCPLPEPAAGPPLVGASVAGVVPGVRRGRKRLEHPTDVASREKRQRSESGVVGPGPLSGSRSGFARPSGDRAALVRGLPSSSSAGAGVLPSASSADAGVLPSFPLRLFSGVSGLCNRANDCFALVAVQTLLHVPPFVDALSAIRPQPIASALLVLQRSIAAATAASADVSGASRGGRSLRPRLLSVADLYAALRKVSNRLVPCAGQQSFMWFFRDLLSGLQLESPDFDLLNAGEFGVRIDASFVCRCSSSWRSAAWLSPFVTIYLRGSCRPGPGVPCPLSSLLNDWSAGLGRIGRVCDQCGSGVDRGFGFGQVSRFLFIELFRGVEARSRASSDMSWYPARSPQLVDIPPLLDISRWLVPVSPSVPPLHLWCVVHHFGVSSDGGHFVVDILCGDGWVRFDDSSTSFPPPSFLCSDSACFLGYRRE